MRARSYVRQPTHRKQIFIFESDRFCRMTTYLWLSFSVGLRPECLWLTSHDGVGMVRVDGKPACLTVYCCLYFSKGKSGGCAQQPCSVCWCLCCSFFETIAYRWVIVCPLALAQLQESKDHSPIQRRKRDNNNCILSIFSIQPLSNKTATTIFGFRILAPPLFVFVVVIYWAFPDFRGR